MRNPVKIEDVKQGDIFYRKETSKEPYMREEYNRSLKKFGACKYLDIAAFIYLPKGKIVFAEIDE